jgi:myo-inositol-1(or 4)-monophosphatase
MQHAQHRDCESLADLAPRLAAAAAVAREAGRLARRHLADSAGLAIAPKGLQDFVTAADGAVEHLIVERLGAAFPGDAFLGEEHGASAGAADAARLWVIDPIDGTANFMRDLPGWCISIALVADGRAAAGVVYDPVRDELYSGAHGLGAFRDGQPIGVSARTSLEGAVVGLGFSYRRPPSLHVEHVRRLLDAGVEYRRIGSGALGVAYVADGRLDAYIEQHINAWDVLAGLAIVAEAGGWTTDFLAGDGLSAGSAVLATTPALKEAIAAAAGLDAATFRL